MRARWVGLVLMGLSGAMLLAPEAAPQQASYRVAGQIVDAVSGTPLARAMVTLDSLRPDGTAAPANRPAGGAEPEDAEQVTGPDGEFRFASVAPGLYALRASRRGYVQASLDQHGAFFAGVVVGPGHLETQQIRFGLLPEAEIHGVVRDSSGDPVEGGQMQLFAQGFDGTGQVRRVRSGSIQPGSSQYKFSNLAPGTYYVAVTARPWYAMNSNADGGKSALNVAYPTTFYDATDRSDNAQALMITAGERVEADFHLQAVPAIEVKQPTGRGSGRTIGSPAFGGTLSLPMQMVYPEQLPGTDGRTEGQAQERPKPSMLAWVAPGEYTREVGGAMTTLSLTEDTTLPGETATGSVEVSGRVVMADGSAMPSGTTVVLTPVLSGDPSRSRFRRRSEADSSSGIVLGVASDGSFTGQAPAERRYQLSARAGGRACAVVGLATTGVQVSPGPELILGSGPVMLAATLARAQGSVQGRVVMADGSAAAGMMVLLVPEDAAMTELNRQDESNLDGSFRLDAVAAGRYRVLAIADGWGLAWKEAAVLGRYLAGGQRVVGSGVEAVLLAQPVVVQQR